MQTILFTSTFAADLVGVGIGMSEQQPILPLQLQHNMCTQNQPPQKHTHYKLFKTIEFMNLFLFHLLVVYWIGWVLFLCWQCGWHDRSEWVDQFHFSVWLYSFYSLSCHQTAQPYTNTHMIIFMYINNIPQQNHLVSLHTYDWVILFGIVGGSESGGRVTRDFTLSQTIFSTYFSAIFFFIFQIVYNVS